MTGGEREKKEAQLKRLERLLKYKGRNRTGVNEEQGTGTFHETRSAMSFVRSWKINQALYRKYGGRVAFQQAGAEPVDAYRDFLKEQETKGQFPDPRQNLQHQFLGVFHE